MNIYEFRSSEKEWVCANTICQAIRIYEDFYNETLSDLGFTDESDIVIIPKSNWYKFCIMRGYDTPCCSFTQRVCYVMCSERREEWIY